MTIHQAVEILNREKHGEREWSIRHGAFVVGVGRPTLEFTEFEAVSIASAYERRRDPCHDDNPEWDGTDAAHPAWWRGEAYGFGELCRAVNETLDGEAPTGTCGEPWQSTRLRLWARLNREAE